MDANDLRKRLRISGARLDEVNALLLNPDSEAITAVLDVVARYGTPEEINRKAAQARKLSTLTGRLRAIRSPYLKDLKWLTAQRDAHAFVSMADYRKQVLGKQAAKADFDEGMAVTLEVSALQYFPVADRGGQAVHRQPRADAGALHPRAQDERVGGRSGRPGGHRRGHADHRRVLRGDAGHQGHRRLQRPPERPGHHHRLLWRHRPAQRLPAQVAGRVPVLLHELWRPAGAQHQRRAPSWSATCCTSWASTTSSRSASSWARTTPTPSCGRS